MRSDESRFALRDSRYLPAVAWRFLTNHGRALLALANHPDMRIRDLATALDITERSAQKIVGDLVKAGYVSRTRIGRRNAYEINMDMPLRFDRELSVRHLLSTFQLAPASEVPAGSPGISLG
jgi:predicted MarR family transcription regulator